MQHQVADGDASGVADATTSPTAPPSSASSSSNGGTYDFTSFIRPRMYGSTDMHWLRHQHLAGPGVRHVDLDEAEVVRRGLALRAGGELDLTAARHRARDDTRASDHPHKPDRRPDLA